MNFRTLMTGSVLVVAAAVAWPAVPAVAKDAPDKGTSEKSGKSAGGKFDVGDSSAAAAKPKTYRFKATKKGSLGGAQVMTLVVDDVFGGRGETLFVQNNSADAKEYDPLTAVADALKDLKPGALIDVTTEKQKGRMVVTAVQKTELKPGEDLADGYVFVESREDKTKSGTNVTVTLSKFGREVKVGVPMVKEGNDSKPDPKVDYVINRAQAGTVVEAKIKTTGRQPMITEIHEYRKPERGAFVKMKEVEFNGVKAAGFEIKAEDGTPITFTIDGQEQSRNGQKQMVPSPQAMATVQKLKPDTMVEVRYHLAGRAWVMHGIDVVDKKTDKTAKSGDEDMKMGKDKTESDKPADDSKKSKTPAKE